MAIVNRDLDVSEQKVVVTKHIQLAAAGAGTYMIFGIPYPCEIKAARVACRATSGAPTVELELHKFVAGVGVTNYSSSLSTALAAVPYGTSGLQTMALGTAGSTFVRAASGDGLVALIAGANTAFDNLEIEVVIQKLQDIKSDYGSAS